MLGRILEFVAILRRRGVRVATAETIDGVRAALIVGLEDKRSLKDALRAAMVKRPVDQPVYDELFDSYFCGLGRIIHETDEAKDGFREDAEFQEFLDDLSRLLEGLSPGLSDLATALALNDQGAMERILRELVDSGRLPMADAESGMQGNVRMLMTAMGVDNIVDDYERLAERAAAMGMRPELIEKLERYLRQRVRELGELIKALVRMQAQHGERRSHEEKDEQRLLDKSFYYLSPGEHKQMREAVAALARRLKNLMAIRHRRAKRGRLDVKATLRSSLEFGGVPFRIRYEDRRKEKPNVVILCDVSDSVRTVSRFMLQFVHSLQDLYARVRSFVFVADIGEVTCLFTDSDVQTAIQQAITGDVVNVYAHSDFGRAFSKFHRDHLAAVDNRTTVIILGDARNNYNAPNEWTLRDIQHRAKQVIWLNPENSSTWGFGDSEMAAYAEYCDTVEECRNLRQLYGVVERLATT
ncbi:MAG: VWA domain-containing protein [Candidatus Binatia bacterium]